MRPLLALMRKEIAVLFGSPMAYLSLTLVVGVTALIFFDHLKLYNQILFVYASSTLGGFETDTIPDYINLRDTVFYPLITGRPGGTGLGLAVAQDLIGRHDGLIEFDSRPGRTIFTLLLPFDSNELGQGS